RGCLFIIGHGHLLPPLQSDRLPVRVGAEAQERVLREPRVQPVGMGKRMMTGFVRVAPEGYRTDAALKKWSSAAYPLPPRTRPRRVRSKSVRRRSARRAEQISEAEDRQ